MAWFDFLNPVLNPLLEIGPFWTLFILSVFLSFISSILYKYLTDQKMLKEVYDFRKETQKKMKAETDPQKKLALQKELMSKSMNKDIFKQQLKPMIFTLVPFLLLFGWMNAHLMYEPIYPGETYSVSAFFDKGATGKVELMPDNETKINSEAIQEVKEEVVWRLQSKNEGEHTLEIKYDNQSYFQNVLTTQKLAYENPIQLIQNSDLKQIKTNQEKLKPLGQKFNFFGWYPGWFGLYIILSLIFSMALRKILKIY